MLRHRNTTDFVKRHSLATVTVLVLLVLAASTMANASDDISASATLTRSEIAINETGSIDITVNGARSARITPPQIDGLLFSQGGQSSRMQIINGNYSSSITTTFYIQAEKEGSYTIPPFIINAGKKELTTESLPFTVTAKNAIKPPTEESQDNAAVFLTISSVKPNIYVGELVPLTIKAYFKEGMRAESIEPPMLSGEAFVLSPFEPQPQQTSELYQGRRYSVLTWQTTASAIKEGEHKLMLQLNATLLVPQRRQRQMRNIDPFFDDDFFSNFLDSYQKKKVTLESRALQITARSLPKQGRPDNFTGAIGNFDFTVSASPTKISVGDPVTVTMTISGEGNFDRVTCPPFPEEEGWKTYTPTSDFKEEGGHHQGKKVFEQAVVADSDDIDHLPALQFSFFDPEKEAYITKTTAPVALTVSGSSSTVKPPAIKRQQVQAQPQNQPEEKPDATIKLETGKFQDKIISLYRTPWFLAAVIICTLILLCLLFAVLVQRQRNKNSAALTLKRQKRLLTEQLEGLQQYIDNNDSNGFMENSRRILQQAVGRYARIEPSTVTLADLRAHLPAQSPLCALFEATEQHAFAKMNLSTEEMRHSYSMLREELEKII